MSHETVSRVHEGTPWEAAAGYSRAVRVGSRIYVSGTTGHLSPDATDDLGRTYEQARRALRRAIAAVHSLGGAGALVVRSRVYLTPDARWEDAARAHRELLGDSAPANTMLHVHSLIGDGLVVEVELDAEVIDDAIQPAGEQ
jgi:enamine deaminase RidA (YjgF/YER057c/UK114 family)